MEATDGQRAEIEALKAANRRLEKEAAWLAEALADTFRSCPSARRCPHMCREATAAGIREAARMAAEKEIDE